MEYFNGWPVIINDHLGHRRECKQVKFPRSKKKRIRKKFTKDMRNWRSEFFIDPVCYQMGMGLVMNTKMFEQIKKHLPGGMEWSTT